MGIRKYDSRSSSTYEKRIATSRILGLSSRLAIQRGTRHLRKLRSGLHRHTIKLFLLFYGTLAIAQPIPNELLNGLKWRLIGPFRGGRVVAVAGVPGDSTTFYFGDVNGGVWRTMDAGTVWTPIFDSQPVENSHPGVSASIVFQTPAIGLPQNKK